MQIAMVASEVAPFSKEGGLADVLGSLPAALGALGQAVCVISPLYRGVREAAARLGLPFDRVENGSFTVPMGDMEAPCVAWRSRLPETDVTAYFLQNDRYYDRDGYYTNASDHSDFQDNSERFIFLSRGALEMCRAIGLRPDIIHSHDWPTGLVPIYVRYIYPSDFPDTATVFTIHNLAYQGIFWHWDMKLAGLPWSLFTWKMLEYYSNMSFLKAGLVGADVLTTVSKTYAREIQTEEYGCGMHGVLQERAADLYGIVNGIDVAVWDPERDPLIPARYSAEDLAGKHDCKRALQQRFGLPVRADVPLLGMVCRLVDQKGLDLLRDAMPQLMAADLQLAVLGVGEPVYHGFLRRTAEQYPERLGVCLEYDDGLAHLVEAGSDMFLMPSRFEPCGLNQLYSLRYGTVPVVRAVGGLADTVVDQGESSAPSAGATGFTFADYTGDALLLAVRRAVTAYGHRDAWLALMRNGMRQDWSWKRSASEYAQVYAEAMRRAGRQAGN